MKDGYNLVEFTSVKTDTENNRLVTGVDYIVIKHLGNEYTDEHVLDLCKEEQLSGKMLMIVAVNGGEVTKCKNMVFYNEDDCYGFLDCCEWDFRVYASVAFGKDLM